MRIDRRPLAEIEEELGVTRPSLRSTLRRGGVTFGISAAMLGVATLLSQASSGTKPNPEERAYEVRPVSNNNTHSTEIAIGTILVGAGMATASIIDRRRQINQPEPN